MAATNFFCFKGGEDVFDNKTIYLTYKTREAVPDRVFGAWKQLNPAWNIEFSDDSECAEFLRTHYGEQFATMFEVIPRGPNKADLWRMCKLYLHGGVYADIDIEPFAPIETMVSFGDNKLVANLTTCSSVIKNTVFQAFIAVPKARCGLILAALLSFVNNKAYDFMLHPTYDFYRVLSTTVAVSSRMSLNTPLKADGTVYICDKMSFVATETTPTGEAFTHAVPIVIDGKEEPIHLTTSGAVPDGEVVENEHGNVTGWRNKTGNGMNTAAPSVHEMVVKKAAAVLSFAASPWETFRLLPEIGETNIDKIMSSYVAKPDDNSVVLFNSHYKEYVDNGSAWIQKH